MPVGHRRSESREKGVAAHVGLTKNFFEKAEHDVKDKGVAKGRVEER